MKKILTVLIALFFCSLSYAQIAFKTGSIEFDSDLNKINVDAEVNFGKFKADVGVSYDISEKKIDHLHASVKMEAAEIYLALGIAKISKKSIDEVIAVYKVHKDKGWGYIAKQMGIKPGSPEFHALKGNAKNKKNNGNSASKGKGNKSKGGKSKK